MGKNTLTNKQHPYKKICVYGSKCTHDHMWLSQVPWVKMCLPWNWQILASLNYTWPHITTGFSHESMWLTTVLLTQDSIINQPWKYKHVMSPFDFHRMPTAIRFHTGPVRILRWQPRGPLVFKICHIHFCWTSKFLAWPVALQCHWPWCPVDNAILNPTMCKVSKACHLYELTGFQIHT